MADKEIKTKRILSDLERAELAKRSIVVRGAREHNLKNIDIDIPRDKLVVLTGLSGSGKSSLAFDTIYAEGQRRYVESLSSYARMFLGQMEKPDVDTIDGLSPAIAIDQKTTSKNPRSTVGTVTEIYDYLRLLYARVGTPHCPVCDRVIERQSVDQIIDSVFDHPEGSRIIIHAPIVRDKKGEFTKVLDDLRNLGYMRVRIDGEQYELEEEIKLKKSYKHDISVVVDRLVLRDSVRSRMTDSIESALRLADGLVEVEIQIERVEGDPEYDPNERKFHVMNELYSEKFACPEGHVSLSEIEPRMFSFNNPAGACPDCLGLGENRHIDPDLLIVDPDLSLNEGVITGGGWNFHDPKSWGRSFIEALAKRYNFDLDTPWKKLTKKVRDIILYGNGGEKIPVDTSNSIYSHGKDYRAAWQGVIPSIERRYNETGSEEMKANYEQFFVVEPCPACKGARLRPEALAVRFGKLNIHELTKLAIDKTRAYLDSVELSESDRQIADQISRELDARLRFLLDVGLDYLSLDRSSGTLSGGEAQRIRLATQIGSGLTGVLYILDEPSIGLHQRDNARLLDTLKHLRDLGNTVLVVEHDEETMFEADTIIDIGPGAGSQGGEVVAQGNATEIMACEASITGQYLSHKRFIPVPAERRKGNGKFLVVKGAAENNLKNLDVQIPLGAYTCVTGVSGSGKSSLVNGIILQTLESVLNRARRRPGKHKSISGWQHLDKVIAIDQSPIGRTPRSNPATYTGVFDLIRRLYASTPEAKAKGYAAGRFSFNVKGGRCEACSGDGVNKIEMHFLPDIYVPCEVCRGKRYNHETLEVKYKGKSIADILAMTVDEAVVFFENHPSIYNKIITLQEVGLGYTQLGQPSTQLSGGEAQRVKLATELSRRSTGKTCYILDEPTTGLHVADVHKLVDIMQRLTDGGNTVLVIEHNLDVIKTADYVIDLGPEGGEKGGTLVVQGTPEEVMNCPESYTGRYLKLMHERDQELFDSGII